MSLSKRSKKIIVNGLTASRILGALAIPVIFSCASMPALIAVLASLLVTDFFDGKLSRKWGVQTKGGALLDAFGDKVLAVSCLLSLSATNNMMLVPLFLELGITAINVNRELHEENVQSSILGKIKTSILSVLIVLATINVLDPAFLNALASGTIGCLIPNIPDLTITPEVVDVTEKVTVAAQTVTAAGYLMESTKQKDTRSKKIAELKSLKETMIRLFDETKYEEDKEKSFIMIMKK